MMAPWQAGGSGTTDVTHQRTGLNEAADRPRTDGQMPEWRDGA